MAKVCSRAHLFRFFVFHDCERPLLCTTRDQGSVGGVPVGEIGVVDGSSVDPAER